MPRTRSIKSVIIELVMYIGMFAVVGHLCENLYERLMMKSELANMKADLNTLQHYITNIETAYDTLREELQEFASSGPKKSKCMSDNDSIIKASYDAYLVHKPTDSNTQDLLKQFMDLKTSFTKITKNFMQNLQTNKKYENLDSAVPTKEGSTITDKIISGEKDKTNEKSVNFCKCIFKCSAPQHQEEQSVVEDTGAETKDVEREICCGKLTDSNETTSNADGVLT